MATRKVGVPRQSGAPGEIDQELINVQARLADLEYDAAHLGASTLPGMAIPAGADFLSNVDDVVRFYQLTGHRLTFICRSLGVAMKNSDDASRVRFGIYKMRRDELDRQQLILRRSSASLWVTPTSTLKDYKVPLQDAVTITPRDLWFVGVVREYVAAQSVQIAGMGASANGVYGRPASAAYYIENDGMGADPLSGELPASAASPGFLDPEADGDSLAATALRDFYVRQAPTDADRSIPLIHALSRTAERLSWNGL